MLSLGEFHHHYINSFLFGKCKSNKYCKCWAEEENYWNGCQKGENLKHEKWRENERCCTASPLEDSYDNEDHPEDRECTVQDVKRAGMGLHHLEI